MGITLIHGKYVISEITGPSSAVVLSDGAVCQRDGEIIDVGPYEELKDRYQYDEIIGSSSFVVMPGLVNDHSHVGLTPFQHGAPDLPLELWGFSRMRAKDVDPYLDHLYGAALMIKSGTTTVQALHLPAKGKGPFDLENSEKVIQAYRESGMRVSYAPMLANKDSLLVGARGGEDEFAADLPEDLSRRFKELTAPSYLPAEEIIAMVGDLYAKYYERPEEKIRVTVAPSNVHRCTDDLLVGLRDLASKYETGIHIHLQETIYQKLYGLRTWDKTPLQHLEDLDFLGPNVVCGHGVWATDEDIETMVSHGVSLCHNASSNLRLKSGIAPVNYFLDKGLRIALGSDEAGLNDDKDMVQEMRLALNIHRVPGVDKTPPTAHQIFQMATVNGAHASSFGDRVGTLKVGKRADIVLMNLENIEKPYLNPEVSIVDAVVHRGRSIDIDTVLVEGEVIMRERKLTQIDEEILYKEVENMMSRSPTEDELDRRHLAEKIEPYLGNFLEGTLPSSSQTHYSYNAKY